MHAERRPFCTLKQYLECVVKIECKYRIEFVYQMYIELMFIKYIFI